MQEDDCRGSMEASIPAQTVRRRLPSTLGNVVQYRGSPQKHMTVHGAPSIKCMASIETNRQQALHRRSHPFYHYCDKAFSLTLSTPCATSCLDSPRVAATAMARSSSLKTHGRVFPMIISRIVASTWALPLLIAVQPQSAVDFASRQSTPDSLQQVLARSVCPLFSDAVIAIILSTTSMARKVRRPFAAGVPCDIFDD